MPGIVVGDVTRWERRGLRRLFDDPLLVRQGRELVTTPVAESLVEPVRDALWTLERMMRSTRSAFDPATDARTFSIVASDYVTLVFLRPLLARLAGEAPNVRLHPRPVPADFPDQLRRNLTDLLIVPHPHRRAVQRAALPGLQGGSAAVRRRATRPRLATPAAARPGRPLLEGVLTY